MWRKIHMRTPEFWSKRGLPSLLLLPFSVVYGFAASINRRYAVAERASIPVICVGNLVAGGAGKTPVALAIGKLLKDKQVAFITRGYGGSALGPLRVDPALHNAKQVGDEALLLAAQ